MRPTGFTTDGALTGPPSLRNAASFNKQAQRNMKVLAILYKGGDAAKQEPRLLGTVENEVRRGPLHYLMCR